MPKARHARDAGRLRDPPDIGPARVGDIRALDIDARRFARTIRKRRPHGSAASGAYAAIPGLDIVIGAIRFSRSAPHARHDTTESRRRGAIGTDTDVATRHRRLRQDLRVPADVPVNVMATTRAHR